MPVLPGGQAQGQDSVLVGGTIQWGPDSIRYFSKEVKIASKYDPSLVQFVEVDSLGNYTATICQ
ncbi:MAG: hypothetical protein AAFU64_12105 [Bacteroidota bacterium]